MLLEMHHTSLFGDAMYKVNVIRQIKLRRPQSMPTDNTVAKLRAFRVATIRAIIAKHREKVLTSPAFTLLRAEPVTINAVQFPEEANQRDSHCQPGQTQSMICGSIRRARRRWHSSNKMLANLKVMYQTEKGKTTLFLFWFANYGGNIGLNP